METQPELVAHHYTEAGLAEQAIPYWQKAGQRASQRSANVEAVSHLTKGLKLLKILPDIPERNQQELRLQIALGAVLIATKGYASPEARQAYARARELCEQIEDIPELFPVLYGLYTAYLVAAEHKTAHGLAEQLLRLAQRQQAPTFLMPAHVTFGAVSVFLGEAVVAREHLEQGIALYDPQRHNSHAFGVAQDLGVNCLSYAAWALWFLGYPNQALKRTQEALTLARKLAHPYSLTFALSMAARFHQFCRDRQTVHEQAEAAITLCADQGFQYFLAVGTILQGWALAEQGQEETGIVQIRQGLDRVRATGAEVATPYYLALLAETHGRGGQAGEGLKVLGEALGIADKNDEQFYDAELYRLKGALTLQQFQATSAQSPILSSQAEAEVEACFLKAITVARHQQAKSLELRATVSLARLWQWQDKKDDTHQMLADVYGWFTEGFDTKDLQEAEALLDELSESGR